MLNLLVCNGLVIRLKIGSCGFKDVIGFWKIIWMLWCSDWCFVVFSVVMLVLRILIDFDCGVVSFRILCRVVDLFELDLLMIFNVWFCWSLRLMLLIVWILLIVWCSIMFLVSW